MWGTYAYITTYEIKNVGINPPEEETPTPTPTPDVSINPVSCCVDGAIKVAKGQSLKGVRYKMQHALRQNFVLSL